MPRRLQVPVIITVLAAFPESSAHDFYPAERVLEDAVADRAFPGCAAAAGNRGGAVWKAAVGSFDYEGGPRVSTSTLYDLASLTKVVGTTAVVMALARDGKLPVTSIVSRHVGSFTGDGREAVTVEHLLTHSSGLPAWLPLHESRKGYRDIVAGAAAAPLAAPPGKVEVYSDLGFILLGEAAGKAGGAPLPDLERTLVFEPLGLRDTLRNPPASLLDRIVPTEKRARDGASGPSAATRGVVHDENAAAGEGVTGHAGLFSTVDDLAVLAAELLRAWHGDSRLFPREIARQFFTRREIVPGSSRALGWDTPSGASSAGSRFSPVSFGHTGFTGTSIWIDPGREIFVILLSNRVHPSRQNGKIAQVRRRLADTVVLCLEGKIRRL